MLGRQADSCLGAQNAMAPSNSTEPVQEKKKKKKQNEVNEWYISSS
jgi:hypothetical protein